MLLDFRQKDAQINWRITNDGVMGGKSQGNIIVKSDHLLFTGNISLENNGGFSAAFLALKPLRREIEFVTVDILGDGNCYQIKIMTNLNGKTIYYFHEFLTEPGVRQKLTFEFINFQASVRGRKLPDAPRFKSQFIEEIGFLIKANQAGDFSLSVFAIDFIES